MTNDEKATEMHEAVERQVQKHILENRNNPDAMTGDEFRLSLQLQIAMGCMSEMQKEAALTLQTLQLAADIMEAQQKRILELEATLEMLGQGHS